MADPLSIKNDPGGSLQASIDALLTDQNMPFTPVDGRGMWRAWVRTFEKPEAACLDLLDNCFDAALHDDFHGKVEMDVLELDANIPPEGITMMNNSLKPIKSLKDALTIYKSSKNSSLFRGGTDAADADISYKKDAIGENGVGLKHGCATLSDVSFIVTRNDNMIEIGLIAKQLQSSNGVCLPYFSFEVSDGFEEEAVSQIVDATLELESNTVFTAVLAQTLGRGDEQKGKSVLLNLIRSTWKGDWKEQDHVFLLVLHRLHHMVDKFEVIDVEDPIVPAQEFLDIIKGMLPEYYINVPSDDSFEVAVCREKITFTYWPARLVSLTQFKVNVPSEIAIKDYLNTSDWNKEGHPIKIYCGFDAQRVRKDEKKNKVASCFLYIYSRKAGRMVQKFEDGRQAMSLASSNSSFLQGLTVIIDDRGSKLPLKPTKDGIAWTEQKGGENFRINLFDYAAGAARLFWNEHGKLMPKKDRLNVFKKVVESFAEDQDQISASGIPVKCMNDADFVEWKVAWTKSKKGKGKDEIQITRKSHRSIETQGGGDTLLTLSQERVTEYLNAKGLDENGTGVTSVSASITSFPRAAGTSHNPVTPEFRNRAHGSVDASNITFESRKRNAGPADYTGERIIQVPEAPSRRKKKARKSSKARDDEDEQKRIELEIQVKQEQLKNIEANKEIDELRAQVQALQNGAKVPPSAVNRSSRQSQVYSDLARITAERDRLQEENERLRNSKPPAVNRRASAGDRYENELDQVKAELTRVRRERNIFEKKYEAIMNTDRGRAYLRK